MPVAIKVNEGSFYSGEAILVYIERELDAWPSLNGHPNIPILYGLAMKDEEPLIITEFLEINLNSLLVLQLQQKKRMNWKLRLRILEDVADAMLFLHYGKGILHRNLKSRKILLTSDWRAKLCGLAFTREVPTEEDDPSKLTFQIGTLPWMAPELMDPKDIKKFRYDFAVDCFSFGISR